MTAFPEAITESCTASQGEAIKEGARGRRAAGSRAPRGQRTARTRGCAAPCPRARVRQRRGSRGGSRSWEKRKLDTSGEARSLRLQSHSWVSEPLSFPSPSLVCASLEKRFVRISAPSQGSGRRAACLGARRSELSRVSLVRNLCHGLLDFLTKAGEPLEASHVAKVAAPLEPEGWSQKWPRPASFPAEARERAALAAPHVLQLQGTTLPAPPSFHLLSGSPVR